ncbi:cadherin repeat domain-containing protein [uncultured Paraglaciecola sp.]|uniref:cadherin repeat domain-containing protein n=1 Tax=uncultured Paraglaciecola sp. TaxID=1765024 RepID=UPI0030DA4236|tara:strand:- start:12587 stop:14059 length:1473 start_codon:yes stop_codon:yes gene_type:complete
MLTLFKKSAITLGLISTLTLLGGCGSDDNQAPELSGSLLVTVAENTTTVGQYSATDDSDGLTYSISGSDQQLFVIDNTGAVEFINAPDFEEGDTGPYNFTVTVTDAKGLTDSIDVTVSVGDELDTPSLALVQTVAADYSSSQVAYLDYATETVEDGFYAKTQSDYTISVYQNEVFHIGRFFIDTVSKYNAEDATTEIWSYTTQDDADSTSRNPYTLVSLNAEKAYLLRYGSDKIWIVNPQATDFDSFKIGELDLGSYVPDNNTAGTPRPSSAVISDGKLFVAMQRLDDSFAATNPVYLAVFDTTTDSEIETNADTTDDMMGIPLLGLNPLEHSLRSYEDKVYITTRDSYSAVSPDLSLIEKVDINDYSLSTVLSAGDISDNTTKFIQSAAIVSAEKGYFFANETFFGPYREESTLYQFNPSTGEISNESVFDLNSNSIGFIDIDAAGFLWVSVREDSAPGIEIIDTDTNLPLINRLETQLNPSVIRFISE